MNPSSALAPTSITPAEWDQLRRDFHRSMMVDTSLAALAENINGCIWPVSEPGETPAAYIDLAHAEAIGRLASLHLPSAALDLLALILRGTLAFDESLGDMVDVASQGETHPDRVADNLERLGIPPDFPVALCAFKPATLDFFRRENIAVLADLLAFSRGVSSGQTTCGDEFSDLLDAIAHPDERGIARHLPFRPGTSGLHLVEALGLLVRDLSEKQREQLVLQPATLAPELREKGALLAAHFSAQLQEMRTVLASGAPLSRLVASLGELSLQPAVASILRLYLDPAAYPAPPAAQPVKRGFFRRLFGLRD